MIKRKYILYLFCFLIQVGGPINSYCQNDGVIHYSVEDGLPSSEVYNIIEDDYGYIWFLTDMGLSRFNGYEFENFSSIDGLSDNVLFHAQKTKDSTIWILGSNNTVTKITGIKPIISQYKFNDSLKLNNPYLLPLSFYVNDEHQINISYLYLLDYLSISKRGEVKKRPIIFNHDNDAWIVLSQENSKAGLFYLSQDSSVRKQSNKYTEKNKFINYHRYQAFKINETGINVFLSNSNKITIKKKGENNNIIINEPNIRTGSIIDNENFWVNFRYNGVKFYTVNGLQTKHFLPKHSVTDVCIDREGNIWCSTLDDGLFLFKKYRIESFIINQNKDKYINQLAKHNDELIIAHFNGDVSKITKGKIIKVYQSKKEQPAIVKHFKLKKKVFYMSDGNVYSLTDNENLNLKTIGNGFNLFELSNGNYGFTSYAGISFITNNGYLEIKNHKRIYDVKEHQNKLWIASNKGLYLTDDFNELLNIKASSHYSKRVNTLIIFNNYLILGTHGDGLVVIENDSVKYKIQKDVLGTGFINTIFVQDDSTLLVGTNIGLSELIFDKNDSILSSKLINYKDGLINTEVRDIEIINDTVWIATTGGLYYYKKSNSKSDNEKVNYFLKFDEVLINDLSLDALRLQNLSHTENRLSISYLAISFKANKSLEYRFKLEGAETTWNYTLSRKALYPNLNPGNYKFIVQVKGENQKWEENAIAFKIRINFPFWKTWWFIISIICSSIILIYSFFKYRILLYNRDIVREILRYILKMTRRKKTYIIVKEGSKEVRIYCHDINYIKSDGNYIEVHHEKGKTIVRYKIGEFLDLVPDPLEYIQIRRSYIIRIDKVEQLGKDFVIIGKEKLKVGSTFLNQLDKIKL